MPPAGNPSTPGRPRSGTATPNSASSFTGGSIRCRLSPARAATPNGTGTASPTPPPSCTNGITARTEMTFSTRISLRSSRPNFTGRRSGPSSLSEPGPAMWCSPPSIMTAFASGPAPRAGTGTVSMSALIAICSATSQKPCGSAGCAWAFTTPCSNGSIPSTAATSTTMSASTCCPSSRRLSLSISPPSSFPTASGIMTAGCCGARNFSPGCTTTHPRRRMWW